MLPIIAKSETTDRIGIASANGLNAQNATRRYQFQYSTAEAEKIFTDPQISTVAIFTRHNLHTSQVISALQAGKHVFCEKPLAIHQAELDVISQLLLNPAGVQGENAPILMVGFNRRFSPFGQQLKAFLKDRQEPIFASYRINAGRLPNNHWLYDPEQGGGRLVGEGCHFIDFLLFLIEQSPVSISAVNLPDQGLYQEDNVVLTLRFTDGSVGVIEYLANGDRSFPKERVEVFAGGQVAVLDDFRTLQLTKDGRTETHRSRLRQDKGHSSEWNAFNQAILITKNPPIPYTQLIEVTQASLNAVESLRTRETLSIGHNNGED
jgi:predicted dehydrogenase